MMTRICYAITISRSLCAKIDGKVEFIEPPKDAKIGDRLVPESYSGGSKPFVPNQVKRRFYCVGPKAIPPAAAG